MKRNLSIVLVVTMVLMCAMSVMAGPEVIGKDVYDAFDGIRITSNNSTTIIEDGIKVISDSRQGWRIVVSDDLVGFVPVAYKIGNEYFTDKVRFNGAGEYYFGAGSGRHGLNSVKVGKFVQAPTIVKGNCYYSLKSYTLPTEYDGISQSGDGYYAMDIEVGKYIEHIPIGKLKIDLTDEIAVKAALEMNLTDGMIEDITRMRQEVLDEGLDELTLTIFCESLLMSPNPMMRVARTYMDYRGMRMRTTTAMAGRIMQTRIVSRGSNTWNVARQIGGIVMESLGVADARVGVVASGISIFQHFRNMTGIQTVPGSTGDFLEIWGSYTVTRQRTYGTLYGNWVLGATTYRASWHTLKSRQVYRVNNNDRQVITNINTRQVISSRDFARPWTIARGNIGLRPANITQHVFYRVHNTRIRFNL